MNDFTKEELEDIKESLRSYLQQDHCDNGWANGIRTLEDKIQSMIDNYDDIDGKPSEITAVFPDCPKCNSKISDTAAVFWSEGYTKIIEWRASCSNICCDYVLVNKHE